MLILLEKIRKVNKVLQLSGNDSQTFSRLSDILSEVMECNVYIADKDGKLLGHSFTKTFTCELNISTLEAEGTMFPESFTNIINLYAETLSNKKEIDPLCVYDSTIRCPFDGNRYSTYVPINAGGERLGTLVLSKFKNSFLTEDLVVAEVSATVVGMEMMRIKNRDLEQESRHKNVVQMAISTLSYSELEAMGHIFKELNGTEGMLVASKIADRVGITRSVIVNALRKLESAGVIQTRSLGMKGTFIKILNNQLIQTLDKALN
ncbi:GTP-sensing pleiotropic transcriptional regulator CodY [Alkalibaculum sp. M08DMB]|uniref:Global transcriptional regulator CodY n=1 Tax=Alkalibaculum sporogenes TaxID=2655001 RepID=A0A6A7K8Q4_9FIRM|nr:GTP-sensing pleiotropic transcriptional regulator CodY [Alkalibaculum sporogenes]MPW25848.1 GTP-sensing pleiotropic transcriptional regulator CodY [Alkalibaculum sporogenes]